MIQRLLFAPLNLAARWYVEYDRAYKKAKAVTRVRQS